MHRLSVGDLHICLSIMHHHRLKRGMHAVVYLTHNTTIHPNVSIGSFPLIIRSLFRLLFGFGRQQHQLIDRYWYTVCVCLLSSHLRT